jgi:hypothetical protein
MIGEYLSEDDKKNNLELYGYLFNIKVDKSSKIDKTKFANNEKNEELNFDSFPDEVS